MSLSYGGGGSDRLEGAVFRGELYGEVLVAGGGGWLYGGRGNDRLRGAAGRAA